MTLSNIELQNWVEEHIELFEGADVFKNDCDVIEFLLDHCEIEIPTENRYFVKVNCDKIQLLALSKRKQVFSSLIEDAGLSDGVSSLAFTGTFDFSHTNAEWDSVIKLGIYGLRNRIAEYEKRKAIDEKSKGFYKGLLKVYNAALRFIKRAAEKALQSGRGEMGSSLLKLSNSSPSNLFEALQTSVIYYSLQMFFDATYLRTMGRLDQLFYPYYLKDDKINAQRLLLDYVKEIDRLDAPSNIPFALGGTDIHKRSLIDELSYVMLDTYKNAATTNTKLHLLCSDNTPDDIIKKAFDYIRDGSNSIVFMSDKRVIEALEKQGIEHEDAVRYHVVGCYECGGEGELTCSCNARVNLTKALELALNGGVDMLTGKLIGLENNRKIESYKDLFDEFERQVRYLCNCAMRLTDIHEAHYKDVHSSPFLSGTYISALEKGGDLYRDYTAKYNNSSLNAIGLGTVTDSLAAIRKAVYEDGTLTLDEFAEILRSDWKEKEPLRILIKNKYPKYGMGEFKTDEIAKNIVDILSDEVSYKPNVKGGNWRLGLFSIDWRWGFGEKTAASADGRRSGETLSQNTSASFGADKEGATAHLISAARIDTTKTPNGSIVDIDLHSSSVRGANGINALVASLKSYFELGGFAVHYNVLDTDILIDAKKNPEKYPTLQVRLCGWNVLFSTLSEKEKDEFIVRSMK